MGETETIDASFGARITGVRLAELDDPEPLHQALAEHALLVFPGQFLSRDEQDEVARLLGELEFTASPITNLDRHGRVRTDHDHDQIRSIRGNEGWHHDSTYLPVQAAGAVFTAEIVPSHGGATGWADMRTAHELLDPDEQERLAGLTAQHSLEYSQGRAGYLPRRRRADGSHDMYGYRNAPPPRRPLVTTHPITGRPQLTIGRHAHDVDGMEPDESERFLDRLNEWAVTRPGVTYHHQWQVGDAVIWDNRRLMHRATPFDLAEPRRMWHTRIAGDPVTDTALNYDADGTHRAASRASRLG